MLSRLSPIQYKQTLKDLIDSYSSINAENRTVVDDIYLTPTAQILTYLNSATMYIDALHRLDITTIENNTNMRSDLMVLFDLTEDELDNAIDADVERIATTYSLERNEGGYSKGYARFLALNNNPINIPVNTEVATKTDPLVTFKTVNTVSNLVPKYDGTTGFYYVDVAVTCTTVGTDGNVQANRIKNLVGSVSGIVGVNNVIATQGGSDEETNTDLISRINIKRGGRSIPTRKGYETLVLANAGVVDCYVATAKNGSEYITRSDSNACDIFTLIGSHVSYAKDIIPVSTAVYLYEQKMLTGEQLTYPSASTSNRWIEIILTKQPVSRITKVMRDGVEIGTSQYSLIIDTGKYSRSIRGFDRLRVYTGTASTITIEYEYKAIIDSVQNVVDHEDNNVINSDVLIREASKVEIDFDIKIDVYSDYDEDTVKENIESDLGIFFTGGTTSYDEVIAVKKLGERIDYSDALEVALNVAGVDRIAQSDFNMSYSGLPITSSFSPNDIQYARLGTITWS